MMATDLENIFFCQSPIKTLFIPGTNFLILNSKREKQSIFCITFNNNDSSRRLHHMKGRKNFTIILSVTENCNIRKACKKHFRYNDCS